jgi:hypothetical protein
VWIVAAAHEAPSLDLVDDLDLALGVPGLGCDVDPVDLDEIVFVATA